LDRWLEESVKTERQAGGVSCLTAAVAAATHDSLVLTQTTPEVLSLSYVVGHLHGVTTMAMKPACLRAAAA
jgi:hypothetical protein